MTDKPILYFEDFEVGRTTEFGAYEMTEAEIVAFARQYDPQPFHIDAEAAKATPFGGIIASGWHTCAIFMKMTIEQSPVRSAGLGSPGVDEIRWLKPVRPGDVLRLRTTVRDCIPSRSRPMGIVKSFTEILTQRDEVVCTMIGNVMVARRPTA